MTDGSDGEPARGGTGHGEVSEHSGCSSVGTGPGSVENPTGSVAALGGSTAPVSDLATDGTSSAPEVSCPTDRPSTSSGLGSDSVDTTKTLHAGTRPTSGRAPETLVDP